MERLDTTNIMLAVLAVVSVIQLLVVLGVAYAAYRASQSIPPLIEAKLTPVLARLEGVLANLEQTTLVVRTRTEDVSRAIDTVGSTATRVGAVVWPRAAVWAGVAGSLMGLARRWRAVRRARGGMRVIAG